MKLVGKELKTSKYVFASKLRVSFFSQCVMALCKLCGIAKLTNEFPSVTVSEECDHPPLACLRVSCTIVTVLFCYVFLLFSAIIY